MATQAEDVYATLLLSDSYLPGALVLAHSLRDAGTKKKLAVLVTSDSMTADALSELRKLYDYIIPIDPVINQSPANLYLMNRPDLGATFTKIQLWKLTQFRKIVYVDADMVALRAPDELFALSEPFSAAPDIGWPDLFNSGLMALNPNLGDYYALLAMAQRGISFDGADQGLLNMHFKNSYNRLSFTYNVTPSAHYQYVPAYKHFQSSINLVHFIGPEKPWTQGRYASYGSGPFNELLGRWWSVYDRHFRAYYSGQGGNAPQIVRQYVKGEETLSSYNFFNTSYQSHHETPQITVERPQTEEWENKGREEGSKEFSVKQEFPVQQESSGYQEPPVNQGSSGYQESSRHQESTRYQESQVKHEPNLPLYSSWDPTKAPPPASSRGEASDLPSVRYAMSEDTTPFKAPESYPEPPKNLHYEVPKTPTYQKPTPIFPWEKSATVATRVFPEDEQISKSSAPQKPDEDTESPARPRTPSIKVSPTDPYKSFQRGNAWDDIPEIERYIGSLQKNRKGNIQVLQGYGTGIDQVSSPGQRRGSMKLTDFPTELERPSLPVTPAPMRRPTFWGTERDEEGELPAAEGVPSQEEWDPVAQLEALAQRQSDVLSHRLNTVAVKEIPNRPLLDGSDSIKSPSQTSPANIQATQVESPPQTDKSPLPTSPANTQENQVESPFQTNITPPPAYPVNPQQIEKPSFNGPGASWEKDETLPAQTTPLGPSEEEKDVLET